MFAAVQQIGLARCTGRETLPAPLILTQPFDSTIMIRLALISSTLTADTYGALSTRLHRAAWTAYAPVDSGGSGQALGQVTEAASAEALFADRVDAFDAVVIDADQVTAERLA